MIIKKHYKDHLEALHRLSQVIRTVESQEAVFQLVLEEVAAVLKVDRASIMRFDPAAGVLRVVAAKGIDPAIWKEIAVPVGEGISGKVFAEKSPLLVKDVRRQSHEESKSDYKTYSFMAAPIRTVPMQIGETPIGVINVTDKTDQSSFSEKDLQLLTIIADQVAAYLHLQDVGRSHRQLEMARLVQERLLPKKVPVVPGLEVAATLIPAERVGADYYDFLNGKGSVGFAIADVSGHDVGGALLAQELRTCFRLKAEEGLTPGPLMQAINGALYEDLISSEQFASMVFARYHSDTNVFSYTSAGHNPLLLYRHAKKSEEWLVTGDSLLGIDPRSEYHEKRETLSKGDIVVFYTDGLTEGEGKQGRRYGQERLGSLVASHADKGARVLIDLILKDWKEFRNNQPAKDDVTLLVIKALS